MKRFFIVVVLIFVSLGTVEVKGEDLEGAAEKVLELVDIPTAYLYPRGDYETKLRIYGEGSLLFRFALSLSDYIMLGAPLQIMRFIGRGRMEIALPPIIWAKIRLTKKGSKFLPMAIGYDPTDYGENDSRRVRGLYLVCTKPAYLYKLPIQWHIGINADLEDFKERGVCSFGGVDFSINPYLLLYTEVDGINFKGKGDPFFNLGVRYLASEQIELEINIRDVGDTTPDRTISFRYSHKLF